MIHSRAITRGSALHEGPKKTCTPRWNEHSLGSSTTSSPNACSWRTKRPLTVCEMLRVIGPLCVSPKCSSANAITPRICARMARRASSWSVIPRTVQHLAGPDGGGSPATVIAASGSSRAGPSTTTTTGREIVAALLSAKCFDCP